MCLNEKAGPADHTIMLNLETVSAMILFIRQCTTHDIPGLQPLVCESLAFPDWIQAALARYKAGQEEDTNKVGLVQRADNSDAMSTATIWDIYRICRAHLRHHEEMQLHPLSIIF